MAHEKVVRRSLSEDKWTRLEFDRVNEILSVCSLPTEGWEVRCGDYDPDGYTWETPFAPITEGDYFGRPDGAVEFRANIVIPDCMDGQRVWFGILTGAEIIVHCDGRILDGLDPNRERVLLTERAEAGRAFALRLEAYTRSKPDDERHARTKAVRGCVQHFHAPRLTVLNDAAVALKYDLDIVYQLAFRTNLPDDARERYQHLVRQLLREFPLYDSSLDELRAAVPRIRAFIAEHILTADSPFRQQGRLACVAHSHLDIAYHWRVRQSVQKNARTCLIQLRLMDRYPELIYSHTQAWCYETLERYYPELFEEIKTRIAEGRWELVGGMYVEPDCNVPNAESLVRQVVYGKLYFLEAFGVEVDNCWLPDVFGNSAILPQILKQGGIDYFVSNKMSTWNDTNRFPHDNFIWRGVDGSEVFACVPPVHFITWMAPQQLLESWAAFQDKKVFDESLQMYGYGDGGSGVTEEMLEHYRRIKDLPSLPELRMCTGKEYLHETFSAPQPGGIPVWDGELYLEMHRGTFTSKADLKAHNRCLEGLARQTEALCTMASLAGAPYPTEGLKEAWKKLLLNQFHDIIPGSHTHGVHVDALATYKEAENELEALRATALAALLGSPATGSRALVNDSLHPAEGVALVTGAPIPSDMSLADAEGTGTLPVQTLIGPAGAERQALWVDAVSPMSLDVRALRPTETTSPTPDLSVSPGHLENACLRIEIGADGAISRILDKANECEVLAPGATGNDWQLFEDKPGTYNAWDIIRQYGDHPVAMPGWESVDVVENGPISVAVRLRRTFRESVAEQVIRLYADSPRVDFETWIDWQETEKLLKVAFPVQVRSRFFTTDTSAGVLERETHKNTSWQEARFEVCCHKWFDLSEGLFGVSILNDGKYGCDVHENVMRLTLLKAPIRPDRESDKGEHRFTYSLMTHGGDWRRGGVAEEAARLNAPLRGVECQAEAQAEPSPLFTISAPGLKCQALKCAEDGSGDVVLRLVEIYGAHGTAELNTGFTFSTVQLCDLLERPTADAVSADRCVTVPYAPNQIQTLRFTL